MCERGKRENHTREADCGKTLIGLSDFGTVAISFRIFLFISRRECVNNGASMRNLPSIRLCLCPAVLPWVAGAVLLAFSAPLAAQCSSGDDPNSFDCQLQGSAPLPSTTQ